jgi:hypothetical protein
MKRGAGPHIASARRRGDEGLRCAGDKWQAWGLAERNGTGWGFHERCCWGLMGGRLFRLFSSWPLCLADGAFSDPSVGRVRSSEMSSSTGYILDLSVAAHDCNM